MSANNFILVKQYEDDPYFVVTEQIADEVDGDGILTNIGSANTLEEAVRLAQDYETELNSEGMYIEYGIDFDLLP